jgi:hypothetical protein
MIERQREVGIGVLDPEAIEAIGGVLHHGKLLMFISCISRMMMLPRLE